MKIGYNGSFIILYWYFIMFSNRYILHSLKYTSHKTNKILLVVLKKKQLPMVKFKNSIFECNKYEYCKHNNMLYKITRNTYLNIAKNLMRNTMLKIMNINNLSFTIKYLRYLSNLTILYIYNNQITYIPKSIGMLTNLRKLSIYNNQLTRIPKTISNLSNLQTLILSKNNITRIHKSIGNLSNLNTLDISNNKLTNIPKSIKKLSNLQIYI
jgi:Leucine-rich repeat (LRR) protein